YPRVILTVFMCRHPHSEAGASGLHTSSQPDSAPAIPPCVSTLQLGAIACLTKPPSSTALRSAIPSFSPPAMVGNVDRLEAVSSNFNQVFGNQENHTIRVSSAGQSVFGLKYAEPNLIDVEIG